MIGDSVGCSDKLCCVVIILCLQVVAFFYVGVVGRLKLEWENKNDMGLILSIGFVLPLAVGQKIY